MEMKSDMKENKDAQFEALYKKAWAAGAEAANATVPTPMAFQNALGLNDGFDWNRPYEVVADGACGFAWVKIRPANSAFGRWLKKVGKVKYASYGGGYDIWISDYNQSVQRKEAHAEAMAKVLQAAGIKAYAQSRLD